MNRQREVIKRLHKSLDIPKGYYRAANTLDAVGRTVIRPDQPRPLSEVERTNALDALVGAGIIESASVDAVIERMAARLGGACKYDYEAPKHIEDYVRPNRNSGRDRPSLNRARSLILQHPDWANVKIAFHFGMSPKTISAARCALRREGLAA